MKTVRFISALLSVCLLAAALSVFCSADVDFTQEVSYTSAVSETYGSRYSSEPSEWLADGEVDARTEFIMPDYGNTGYVSDYEDLADFGVKYPLVPSKTTSNGVTYTINDTVAAYYGYTFSSFKIEQGCLSVNVSRDVAFHDFFLDAARNGTGVSTPRTTQQGRVILLDGELLGSTGAIASGFNITMKRCYLHHAQADHVKGFTGLIMMYNLITEGGLNGGNPHPDGVQFSVDDGHGKGLSTDNVFIVANRFDNMLTKKNTTNSCIIVKSEFGGGISNMHIDNNWFNGGGVSNQICVASAGQEYFRDVTLKDNLYGCGEKWKEHVKYYNDIDGISLKQKMADATGNVSITGLQVGSVIYRNSQNKRVLDLTAVSNGELRVDTTVANYTNRAIDFYYQATLYAPDGKAVTTVGGAQNIRKYVEYANYIDLPDYFGFEHEPTNEVISLEFTSLPSDLTGYYIVTEVFSITDNGRAVDRLRSDTVAGTDTLPVTYTPVIPAGYTLYDRDLNSPSNKFTSAVASCSAKNGEELRLAIIEAYSYFDEADDNKSGVVEARQKLQQQVNRYNQGAAEDNALMQKARAVTDSRYSQLVEESQALLVFRFRRISEFAALAL